MTSMAMRLTFVPAIVAALLAVGCGRSAPPKVATVAPTAAQLEVGTRVGLDERELTQLLNTSIYKMKPEQVGRYLGWLHAVEPDLRARIAAIGRKNIGQPYELYLLGEFPYETTDGQPLFSLEKSDCVVFAEHTYAMALSQSWEEFFWMLQRIRYKAGVIGVATRNHYTETDWNHQNAWLVTDVSSEIAGARAATYTLVVDRQKFFKSRYKLDRSVPVESSTESYVPKEIVDDVASQLQEGDYVNVISGKNGEHWASHVGIVVLGTSGERHLLHSSDPVVREETFGSFIARAAAREARNRAAGKNEKVLAGFKFLRLNDHPEVPPMAPQPRPRPNGPSGSVQ